jgi:hypothetical protein
MLWYILAGAAGLGIGPLAFRQQMEGLLSVLVWTGLILFVIVLYFVLTVTEHVRCSLGNQTVCGEMQRTAALTLWPTQAVVAGWTTEQMDQYANNASGRHRWTMLRAEPFAGENVTTSQICVGNQFPTTLKNYQENCLDRQIISPGSYAGRLIATPGADQVTNLSYYRDQVLSDLKYATEPKPPYFTSFHPNS